MMSTELISLLDRWVREAVARHGDNWPAIMASVEEKLEELGETQRKELSLQVALILASCSAVGAPNPN